MNEKDEKIVKITQKYCKKFSLEMISMAKEHLTKIKFNDLHEQLSNISAILMYIISSNLITFLDSMKTFGDINLKEVVSDFHKKLYDVLMLKISLKEKDISMEDLKEFIKENSKK